MTHGPIYPRKNGMEPTDEELMKSYQMGDSKAFEILYRRNSAKVFGYLKARLRRSELAEECFQVVFAKFHRLRERYDSRYSVEQWLYVISKSTLLDYFRKQGREVSLDHEIQVESLDVPSSTQETETESTPSLENLPLQQRQVVQWRALDELTYEEIAKRLGESEVNTRQIFSRAMKKLRAALKPEGRKV